MGCGGPTGRSNHICTLRGRHAFVTLTRPSPFKRGRSCRASRDARSGHTYRLRLHLTCGESSVSYPSPLMGEGGVRVSATATILNARAGTRSMLPQTEAWHRAINCAMRCRRGGRKIEILFRRPGRRLPRGPRQQVTHLRAETVPKHVSIEGAMRVRRPNRARVALG